MRLTQLAPPAPHTRARALARTHAHACGCTHTSTLAHANAHRCARAPPHQVSIRLGKTGLDPLAANSVSLRDTGGNLHVIAPSSGASIALLSACPATLTVSIPGGRVLPCACEGGHVLPGRIGPLAALRLTSLPPRPCPPTGGNTTYRAVGVRMAFSLSLLQVQADAVSLTGWCACASTSACCCCCFAAEPCRQADISHALALLCLALL